MKISKHKNIASLRNETHFQLHADILDLIAECGAGAMRLEPQYLSYKACHGREDDAFKKVVKSPVTIRMQDSDRARDEAWGCLEDAVKIAQKHPDSETRKKAYGIRVLLKTYGNVARKPYNDETAAIVNVVQDLESEKYAADVQAIGAGFWVAELKARNLAFKSLAKERLDESADRCSIALKGARAETDEAYRVFIEHVAGFILAFGKDAYDEFVTKHNLLIAKYNANFARSHASKGKAPGEQEEGT